MTDITYIVATAKTWVQVPLMAFTDRDEAIALLKGFNLLEDQSIDNELEFSHMEIDGKEYRLRDVLAAGVEPADEDKRNNVERTSLRLISALFQNEHYYDGRGAIDSLRVITKSAGVPVVEFDLG